jgi:pyruvate formate-lyase activating enzyme-like uncharacterized protein
MVKRELSEAFKRYALGLARAQTLPQAKANSRTQRLIAQLQAAGIKGWPEHHTFYTKSLPKGCQPCLRGQGSNLVLTLKCNRDCFFCFNPKPRTSAMSVHGQDIRNIPQAARHLKELGVKSVGISGGEPLLEPKKLLSLVRALRQKLDPVRIDLYSNGVLFTPALLRSLKQAGVDGLRINLAADDYSIRAVALAKLFFKDVEVEIPVIPEHKARLIQLLGELEALDCKHLIIHELFSSAQNIDALLEQGRKAKPGSDFKNLTWQAVAHSEETALELLLAALTKCKKLSVYYCSCGTQAWIAERALKRRKS